MILSTAIVFNLIGLGWTLSTIGKSFLYVKEKVAQDVGVIHLSQLPFVLFHFIQNEGLRITGTNHHHTSQCLYSQILTSRNKTI